VASMGPRLMSRGKAIGGGRSRSGRAGFNGAAAHEPRKVAAFEAVRTFVFGLLQWGRGS